LCRKDCINSELSKKAKDKESKANEPGKQDRPAVQPRPKTHSPVERKSMPISTPYANAHETHTISIIITITIIARSGKQTPTKACRDNCIPTASYLWMMGVNVKLQPCILGDLLALTNSALYVCLGASCSRVWKQPRATS
jgi:hypothetical protein